jgi:hypothetical protein
MPNKGQVMAKKYARVDDYGELLIPLDLMAKIMDQCYIIRTTYENDKHLISDVKPVSRLVIHDHDEVRSVLAQKKLEGK